jgi:hypothetical protein
VPSGKITVSKPMKTFEPEGKSPTTAALTALSVLPTNDLGNPLGSVDADNTIGAAPLLAARTTPNMVKSMLPYADSSAVSDCPESEVPDTSTGVATIFVSWGFDELPIEHFVPVQGIVTVPVTLTYAVLPTLVLTIM